MCQYNGQITVFGTYFRSFDVKNTAFDDGNVLNMAENQCCRFSVFCLFVWVFCCCFFVLLWYCCFCCFCYCYCCRFVIVVLFVVGGGEGGEDRSDVLNIALSGGEGGRFLLIVAVWGRGRGAYSATPTPHPISAD